VQGDTDNTETELGHHLRPLAPEIKGTQACWTELSSMMFLDGYLHQNFMFMGSVIVV
jgi:hypothetical protein